ncbi:AraC family transcriptional regulator [Terribacillus saccharophilus]|uniref:AraC family transcriptional regulator n=1 Tax=Terribacillus saccharophilus TaxID=361277 RepID=A0A268ACF8_9BACI|nr:AraC family transcriptional regulator [Terribacillus saccharophilus]PAD21810.1 AraC family transcriptional regulator [Terribacillus saccharophilus]
MISDFDKQQELDKLISKYTDLDGVHPTSIESLFLIRESTISEPVARVNEISFCIIVQGEKEVLLGEECFKYGPGNFIVASVELPVTGQVINASYDFPYLALKLEFTPKDILEVLDETGIRTGKRQDTKRAMFIGESEPSLLDAVIRLASLLDKQKHIPILAPLYKKEILYWVLQGPNGNALQQMAVVGSNAMRIRDVIEYIISDFEKSFRIEDLADIANMSVSSLHRHFKEVTAMSPIQFQKQLRLQEARRLLLAELPDIADVAFRVGYESQSQFTREYARMFGFSPRADIKRLREEN